MIDKNSIFCLVQNGTINKYNVRQKDTGLGVNSSVETYNTKGFYLLVDNKPAVGTAQRIGGSVYEIDEVAKTVTKVYTIIDIPLDELITAKLSQLTIATNVLLSARPRVATSLGFDVDGGADDLRNLESAKALGLTFVVDADNVTQTIAVTDWDIILNAIRANGLAILQNKWALKAQIEACTTVEQLDAIVI